MTDVLPTLLSAAGAKPEKEWKVTGSDVLEVWKGKAKSPDRTLFWEWRVEGYNQLAAMKGSKKLVLSGGAPAELFDVVRDPGERRNVIQENRELADKLRKELTAWMATETEESKWGKKKAKEKK
jgi:arylsulfatase A-like enzyme